MLYTFYCYFPFILSFFPDLCHSFSIVFYSCFHVLYHSFFCLLTFFVISFIINVFVHSCFLSLFNLNRHVSITQICLSSHFMNLSFIHQFPFYFFFLFHFSYLFLMFFSPCLMLSVTLTYFIIFTVTLLFSYLFFYYFSSFLFRTFNLSIFFISHIYFSFSLSLTFCSLLFLSLLLFFNDCPH